MRCLHSGAPARACGLDSHRPHRAQAGILVYYDGWEGLLVPAPGAPDDDVLDLLPIYPRVGDSLLDGFEGELCHVDVLPLPKLGVACPNNRYPVHPSPTARADPARVSISEPLMPPPLYQVSSHRGGTSRGEGVCSRRILRESESPSRRPRRQFRSRRPWPSRPLAGTAFLSPGGKPPCRSEAWPQKSSSQCRRSGTESIRTSIKSCGRGPVSLRTPSKRRGLPRLFRRPPQPPLFWPRRAPPWLSRSRRLRCRAHSRRGPYSP